MRQSPDACIRSRAARRAHLPARSGPALHRFEVRASGRAEIAQALGDQARRCGFQPLLELAEERVAVLARLDRVEDLDAEAVALASTKQPGLILADIQLADGSSGLEAVKELLRSFEAPVIFITAYPERFLTGDRPEPAFLISKPFQPAMVSAIASQALFFDRKAKQQVSRVPA